MGEWGGGWEAITQEKLNVSRRTLRMELWIQVSAYAEEMQSNLKHLFQGLTYLVIRKTLPDDEIFLCLHAEGTALGERKLHFFG